MRYYSYSPFAYYIILIILIGVRFVVIILTLICSRLKRISSCCLDEDAKHLYIGTDAGNIYDLDVAELTLVEDPLIHQDAVLQKYVERCSCQLF